MKRKMTFDPMEKFQHIPIRHLFDACGYLIPWALDENCNRMTIKQCYEHFYKFGMNNTPGTEVDKETGVWKYPGDPDLYPIMRMTRGDEVIYFYQHALVAWFDKDNVLFATRMD